MNNNKSIILLVEDNDDDADLTTRAFLQAQIDNPIFRVHDGIEALDYLLAKNKFSERNIQDTPVVILLDLNLPRLDGLGVLKAIRSHLALKHLPIIILTSSNEDKDKLIAYEHYANSYVQKPVDYDQFLIVAKKLGLYWLLLNQSPPIKLDSSV